MFPKYHFCVLFAALIVQTLATPLTKEELECVAETELNADDLDKYKDFALIAEDDSIATKFLECLYTKFNLYDDNSNLKLDDLKKASADYLTKTYETSTDAKLKNLSKLYIEGFDECAANTYSGSKGELAIKFHNCVIKNKIIGASV